MRSEFSDPKFLRTFFLVAFGIPTVLVGFIGLVVHFPYIMAGAVTLFVWLYLAYAITYALRFDDEGSNSDEHNHRFFA